MTHAHTWRILLAGAEAATGRPDLYPGATVTQLDPAPSAALAAAIGGCDALIAAPDVAVPAAVFAAADRLRVVGRPDVSIANIDLIAATQQGVTVVNAPRAAVNAVAEYTLALIFALARRLPQLDRSLKAGEWRRDPLGADVAGKTLGLIGCGQIGQLVGQRAAALGMGVLAYDPYQPPEGFAAGRARPAAWNELLAAADFISLHVPLAPSTRGLIDGQALGQMRRGVRLICTARGGLIDEVALVGALESGQVAGAALDVFRQQPPGLSALVAHPQVIATPHIAAQTQETHQRAAQDTAAEVLAALKNEPLRWQVV
jgi:D-3-phosphoglycerate dehydrogenase